MDTVTKVGLQGSMLGLTHQSSPAGSSQDAGAPHAASTNDSGQKQTTAPEKPASSKNDSGAVDQFLNNLRSATTRLRISQDEKMGVFVYQAVDPSSGEVKHQYPSKERLREMAYLAELNSKKHGTTV
ncbi:MAG TPA: flagellar protein FlaG [Alphaproteobacteria bacterium]|nr:flagellar protein FlaG [Alphaproteobacteria bacterium]